MKSREAARQAIRTELASLGTLERLDARALESEARARLTKWRVLLQVEAVGR